MSNENKWTGHALMLGANTMWGLMSPMAKIVMITGAITPIALTNLRMCGAMILFWIASLFTKHERVPLPDLIRLFGAAMLAIVCNQECFIYGVSLTSPADASIMTTTMPIWAMVLAAGFLKERITGKKIAGMVAGLAGALLLILGNRTAADAAATGENPVLGGVFVLTAQLAYASYIVFYKNFVKKYSFITIMKWMFTFAFVCAFPFSLSHLVAIDWSMLGVKELSALGFVIVGATFVSYMLSLLGLKRLSATVSGMYHYVQPIVASIVAIFLGLSDFHLTKLLAVALIFGGVYVVNSAQNTPPATEATEATEAEKSPKRE